MDYASLTWNADGTPHSVSHGDVYFSREGGRAETELVFLEGNRLPTRWQGGKRFTIGETGFGTGLNFLHTLARFEETAPAEARLHYISVENAPLAPADLARAHACWPELAEHSAPLQRLYPLPIAGWHRLHFPRATLTLGLGDGLSLLRSLDAAIDAWFLDGFAPAKNPDLWQQEIIAEIARLSATDATLASFTAAGAVRRALEAAGFSIERRDGFGHKRHRIVGWRKNPSPSSPPMGEGVSTILIVGAGIAGASAAHALALRGYNVTVIERAGEVAAGASGNRAGVLYPQVTKERGLATRWYFSGYAHALRLLAGLDGLRMGQPGMLKRPKDAKEEARLREAGVNLGLHREVLRYVEAEEAATHTGLPMESGGAWFPHGSWVDVPRLVARLLQHPNITLHCNTALRALAKHSRWQADTTQGTMQADAVILACAHACADFAPLRLAASAGQVSLVPVAQATATLQSIVCHRGYIIPEGEHYLVGATYDHEDLSGTVTETNHAHNRAEAEAALPGWLQSGTEGWKGRTSLRATTPDRLPYVGALGEGLYVSTGHGSRGLLSAPLGAECIASLIAGEPVPLEREVWQAVTPSPSGRGQG